MSVAAIKLDWLTDTFVLEVNVYMFVLFTIT